MQHGRRTQRDGFTLVELLVAMAVIVLILSVLAQAFQAGTETMGRFKAIGNMSDHLRTAAQIIRGDLAANHFDGGIRLSDPQFYSRVPATPPAPADWPREGFFCVRSYANRTDEGSSDGIYFRRTASHALNFTVKLRGNRERDFFAASAPGGSAVFDKSTFFDQPEDCRCQSKTVRGMYRSQWAEIAYFVLPVMSDSGAPLLANGQTPLYSLYRAIMVLVPDNSRLGAAPNIAFSRTPTTLFNTPASVRTATNRPIPIATQPESAMQGIVGASGGYGFGVTNLLLTDVVSFEVQLLPAPRVRGMAEYGANDPDPPKPFGHPLTDPIINIMMDSGQLPPAPGLQPGTYDSAYSPYGLLAISVTLRIWDQRTQQARQITIFQDL